MATKSNVELNWCFVLIFACFSIFFSRNLFAEILIKHSEVSEQEFKKYLAENPNFDSFQEYFITKNDYLDYATAKLFFETEDEGNLTKKKILIESLYEKIGSSLLSNQKKELWIATLELAHKNINFGDQLNFGNQLFSIKNKNSLFERLSGVDYYQLTELNFDQDDDIFVNGWNIGPGDRNKVFLDKSLFYHFLFLSNSKTPFIKIDKPENLNVTREPLVSGACENALFNSKTSELVSRNSSALFLNNCLNKQTDPRTTDKNDELGYLNNFNNSNSLNMRESVYTYGAIMIGIAILANYTELKNYRFKITLPF